MSKEKEQEKAKQEIVAYVEKTLKDNFIKNMMMGFQTANEMILRYINDGHDIDEVKTFLENNLKPKGKKAMEKVLSYDVVEEIKGKSNKKTKKKKGKGN